MCNYFPSKKKKIVLAVVYYPHDNIVYYAEKNKGAYVNDKKIHVSKVKYLGKAYLGYGNIKYFQDKQPLINLIQTVASTRGFESTYNHCLVAERKMDISVDAYGKVWDLAPFKLLIEEAEGKITRLDGSKWALKGSGAVITNGVLHDEVIRILNQNPPKFP